MHYTCMAVFFGVVTVLSGMSTVTRADITTQPAQSVVKKPHAVLSELTLDRDLGSDGSWVEIYNPGDDTLSLEGLHIICDGREVYAFPAAVSLPGKAMIVVRFGSESGSRKELQTRTQTGVVTIYLNSLLKEGKPEPSRRKPGYCALVAQRREEPKSIVDYVQWGQKTLEGKALEEQRLAVASGHWPAGRDGIYIGIESKTGPILLAVDRLAVLSRMRFPMSGDGQPRMSNPDSWLVLPEECGTPGSGNMLPPPLLCSPSQGAGIAADQDLQIVVRCVAEVSAASLGGDKNSGTTTGPLADVAGERSHVRLPYRVQIAKDPHFQEIILDAQFGDRGRIERGKLKPGRYYARVRMDIGVTTNWSEANYFSYE